MVGATKPRTCEISARINSLPIQENNRVKGVQVGGELQAFDAVVSTVPLPFVTKLVPDLPNDTKQAIEGIPNVGVVCVLFKLKQQLTRNFWTNITDKSIEIPGLIEYTNLQEYDNHIVYAPYYMSQEHRKYHWKDSQFVEEATGYLQKINSEFSSDWVIDTHVARYGFAQTVCRPNFFDRLPPMRSSITGFYMADTAYYYPEDRSIAQSVRVGEQLAGLVNQDAIKGLLLKTPEPVAEAVV